jgi:hypothetical protein
VLIGIVISITLYDQSVCSALSWLHYYYQFVLLHYLHHTISIKSLTSHIYITFGIFFTFFFLNYSHVEELSEDTTFPAADLAAAVASKCFYHLQGIQREPKKAVNPLPPLFNFPFFFLLSANY